MATLKEALPNVSDELADGLRAIGDIRRAEQVHSLALVDRCRCGDTFCATFYVQPEKRWSGQELSRLIPTVRGLFCAQLYEDEFAVFEFHNRSDIRDALIEHLG